MRKTRTGETIEYSRTFRSLWKF